MAVLCIGAIFLSAAWTNGQRAREVPGAQVLADESQRLGEKEEILMAFCRPAEGEILRTFSRAPVYFEQRGLWQAHPGLDFVAQTGERVYAMKDGCVRLEERGLSIDCPDGSKMFYRGIGTLSVTDGQNVSAGDVLGLAGNGVPFEGENHICVQLWQAGDWMDFSKALGQ